MSDQLSTEGTNGPVWRFAIDVGGTFTDCVGITPTGDIRVCKTLSSGRTKGVVGRIVRPGTIADSVRRQDPARFWVGAKLCFGGSDALFEVVGHDAALGTLTLATPIPEGVVPGTAYEIATGDEAPVLGIRYLLGLASGELIPACEVRLGTTRGTNALLERRGAKVGFLTTQGFADLLLIGDQARPHLFELAIRKPAPLTAHVVEVTERLAADGSVLTPLDAEQARDQLRDLYQAGVESVAISLLHSYRNPVHEQQLGAIAREIGFREVVLSHEVSPSIKILPRAESTVLDAYLNPILRDYLQRIETGLANGKDAQSGQTSLLLMTSSGGLVTAGRFSGKESVLSGPAGGAIGFSSTAAVAGFSKSIGFDMGGTSTDVSRFDGRFEMETESRKAGIRIATPTLAIETVAAGGGSICSFDGIKLTVGPASAGAEPGPACYGRGGPLTITDCNLLLGRIVAERFPFPLDVAAAQTRVQELADRMRKEAGYSLSLDELAEGLIAIANNHMARAIRRISVARGYDPQEYVLAVFGGAGAQHACELANELGMPTIVVHPLASVLSAYGIACASQQYRASQTLLVPLATMSSDDLLLRFEELVTASGWTARMDGAPSTASWKFECGLDLRYSGIESTITITESFVGKSVSSHAAISPERFAASYEVAHEREFGFRRVGREIEVVAARISIEIVSGPPPTVKVARSWRPTGAPRPVRVSGQWVEVTAWERTTGDSPAS